MNNKRKLPADYHHMAESRGFRWIGPEVPNIFTGTGWQCEQGHRWMARYGNISTGRGCPFCSNRIPKVAKDYWVLAKRRGFKWLGPEAPTTEDKTEWECQFGHRWSATYQKIRKGKGCPYCYGNVPKTPNDYRALAESRGFIWVGLEAKGVKVKTIWECQYGHRWEATYHHIDGGTGCTYCIDMVNGARVSKVQRALCEMLNGDLNHPFGRYSIDVALKIDGVTIAVEYDSCYWHLNRDEYDTQKDALLVEAGWRILRIKSNTQLPSREEIDVALGRLLSGEQQVEIVLDDWHKEKARHRANSEKYQ